MNIPLYTLLFIGTVSLGISFADHGRPRSNQNGFISLINYIITFGLTIWAVHIGHF